MPAPELAPLTADEREALGLSIDMLDVDRLREWARLILLHGADISHWGSVPFVASKMQTLATGIEKAVRDIGTLRTALSAAEADSEEETALRERLSQLLTQTANALKGEPDPMTLHDWSDLPAVASRLAAENAALREALENALGWIIGDAKYDDSRVLDEVEQICVNALKQPPKTTEPSR